jgi:Xaa-Pro aminopeptidase
VGGSVSDGTNISFLPSGFDRVRAVAAMGDRGLDAILLTSPENVFYATGYTALPTSGNPILYTLRSRLPNFVSVTREGQVTLLCWGFSAEGVEFGIDELRGFNDFAGGLRLLETELDRLGHDAVVGLEATCPLYVSRLAERRWPGRIADADPVMADLRLIKTPAEMELLRQSTSIIESTVDGLYGEIELGMSRLDVMRLARGRMVELGATGFSHLTFSFGRANPEIAIDEPLEPQTLVTLDLGAIYKGYCSDNRRYAFSGSLPNAILEPYRTMVSIVDQVGEMLVPGTSYADIFRAALDLHREHGVAPLARFTHVGHNIGLETEEEWLDDDPVKTVKAGMAINVELYTHASTGEQIGNEETYLVGSGAPERISVLPREIREVA